MIDGLDYPILGTIAVAFLAGYAVVSFIVGKLRSPQKEDTTTNNNTANSDSWESHRRQQEEQLREQERIRRDAEEQRVKEEQRRRADQEESHRRSSSNRSSAIKNEAYYGRVLGLQGRVTWADVRTRYRELVVQYHPDKVNHLGPKLRAVAEQEMKSINEAFEYFKRLYG